MFHFAEKLLLPRLKNQPAQLHFITGFIIDMFLVECINDYLTEIYGLVKKALPTRKKRQRLFFSMLMSTLRKKFPLDNLISPRKQLFLYAENCVGQKKVFHKFYCLENNYEVRQRSYFVLPNSTVSYTHLTLPTILLV